MTAPTMITTTTAQHTPIIRARFSGPVGSMVTTGTGIGSMVVGTDTGIGSVVEGTDTGIGSAVVGTDAGM